MRKAFTLWVMAALIAIMAAPVFSQEQLADPYEILNRHFEANGGLERIKAEQRQYLEGTMAVAGLSGTLKVWAEMPDLQRTEVDLGLLKVTQGDNGRFQWVLDANGKLQKITKLDEAKQKRRELKRHMANYEDLDRQSKIFEVIYDGEAEVDGKNCYVIKISNHLNTDTHTSYINRSTWMLEKTVSIEADDSHDTYYADYRSVDGLMVAFWFKRISHQTGQIEEVTITEYVSNPEIDPMLFEPPGETPPDFRFVDGQSAENIPFRLRGNELYATVTVQCKERNWVFDTGAGMSCISRRFARELGLELEGDIKGDGVGGTVDISLATVPGLTLQGIEFEPQTMAVFDMDELNRVLDIEIDGILGYDFLSRFVTKIDYAAELVSFYDPETFIYTGEGRDLPMHLKSGVFVVEATLDSIYTGTWLFDIGAAMVSLETPFANKYGYAHRKGIERIGHGAAHAFFRKAIKCQSLELAGFKVDEPTVSFATSGADTNAHADEIGGLGNSFFKNFVIYCDYAHERLIVEKGKNFNARFPEDHSGLQLVRGDSGQVKVLYAAEGTPAAQAGFRQGDIIKAINGIQAPYLGDLGALRMMLTEPAGTEYTFLVERDGKPKGLKLKLAELF